MSSSDAVQKFDSARAGEYQAQSRIALAGYDACHELAACMFAYSDAKQPAIPIHSSQ